jgi:hypothetical protein
MKCQSCRRAMVETTEDWANRWSVNCAGDCLGCVAAAEDRAVERWCEFHQRECVVENHYADSTFLCSPHLCIEHQDITTLMINHSYANWHQGEPNEFFDRITQPVDLSRCVDLSGLSDEDFIKALTKKS